jgi:hypothetical protein
VRSPDRAFKEKRTADCEQPNGQGRTMFELSQRHCWAAFALACQPEFILEQPIHPVGGEDSAEFDSFEKPAIGLANSHAAQIDGLLVDDIDSLD